MSLRFSPRLVVSVIAGAIGVILIAALVMSFATDTSESVEIDENRALVNQEISTTTVPIVPVSCVAMGICSTTTVAIEQVAKVDIPRPAPPTTLSAAPPGTPPTVQARDVAPHREPSTIPPEAFEAGVCVIGVASPCNSTDWHRPRP